MYQSIKEFHERFNRLPLTSKPALLPPDIMKFRFDCIAEEIEELHAAYAAGNLHETADALVDTVYFLLGTSYLMSLPFEELFDCVHQANMKKVPCEKASDSKRGRASDVVKPPEWRQPDFTEWLGKKP